MPSHVSLLPQLNSNMNITPAILLNKKKTTKFCTFYMFYFFSSLLSFLSYGRAEMELDTPELKVSKGAARRSDRVRPWSAPGRSGTRRRRRHAPAILHVT